MAIGPVLLDLARGRFSGIWKYTCWFRSCFDVLWMHTDNLIKQLFGFFCCICIHLTFTSEQLIIVTLHFIILNHTLAGRQNCVKDRGTYAPIRGVAYGPGLVKSLNLGLLTFSTAVYKPPFLPNLARTLPCRFMV